jgi:hypothetical protein
VFWFFFLIASLERVERMKVVGADQAPCPSSCAQSGHHVVDPQPTSIPCPRNFSTLATKTQCRNTKSPNCRVVPGWLCDVMMDIDV